MVQASLYFDCVFIWGRGLPATHQERHLHQPANVYNPNPHYNLHRQYPLCSWGFSRRRRKSERSPLQADYPFFSVKVWALDLPSAWPKWLAGRAQAPSEGRLAGAPWCPVSGEGPAAPPPPHETVGSVRWGASMPSALGHPSGKGEGDEEDGDDGWGDRKGLGDEDDPLGNARHAARGQNPTTRYLTP